MSKLAWIFASFLILISDALIMDKSCTEKDGLITKFSGNAVNCENRYPDTSCLYMYNRAVKKGGRLDRDPRCFMNQKTQKLDEGLISIAVNSCPKTCGYCCKTQQ
ncbi:hypothetical protein Y032_0264g624 [Ancylostoma ceylanicum]|uniref:ShKT domain-containing protein n=1 Tax=Ancylostoma ceylanicum TaxID=53326 RepID=A0A016SAD6_9BILA|nr:hypothetical protein Y032_0264g624 [Ancylostoma ceylanicum]